MTFNNIKDTAKELASAKTLRAYVDVLLKQVVDDIHKQTARTNEAFYSRISEMRYIKTQLENVHKETCNRVNDITRNITCLEEELAAKEGYVALSQMRLGNRAHRPGMELCDDTANDQLMLELDAQRDTVGKLTKMLNDNKATLRYLLHTQVAQEEELNIKTNSLKIDEVDCMTIREGLDFPFF